MHNSRMHNGYSKYVDDIVNSSDYYTEFRKLPVEIQGFVFLSLPQSVQKQILKKISDADLIELLKYPAPDDVTDILQNMGSHHRKKIITALEEDMRNKVSYLLQYPPDTAAGLMDLNYILIDKGIEFRDVLKKVEKHKEKTGRDPVVLVQENGRLVGEVPMSAFILSDPRELIDGYIIKVPSIIYDAKQSKVLKLFEHNKHNKVVVLDKDGSIIGIIYSDDVFKLIKKQRAKDIYNFAGLHQEEDIFDRFPVKIRNRAFWLVLNLFATFLASLVIALFDNVISAFVVLAAYMPVIAGMGGDAGTQTLAVTVRGLALHDLKKRAIFRIYINELFAAFLNGLIVGIVAIFLSYFLESNFIFGFIVAVSILLNLLVAVSVGFFIPIILKHFGKDPAAGSCIFITAITDICGFFIFLGLASLIFL